MEFLVTMTTRVPAGTADETVADVRARETENSAGLARQRRLLRLWRPPLGPGEWRSIGLFTASGADDLERTLAAMPLRIWRTDEVSALAAHPNDPATPAPDDLGDRDDGGDRRADAAGSAEFLTEFRVVAPESGPRDAFERAEAQEAERAAELGRQGHLVRLWRLEPAAEPGVTRALGLWRAADAEALRPILDSLPLDPWMTVEVTPLTAHPSDPGHDAP